MYAKNLSILLHGWLSDTQAYEDTLKRFETMRGYGQLPRGRDKAGVRLSNKEIASAVLGFVPTLPGLAGHVALIMSDLRPVGGPTASFQNAASLKAAMAVLLDDKDGCNSLVHLTLSIARKPGNDEYQARLVFEDKRARRTSSFVSKHATSQTTAGAEKTFDHERPLSSNTRQLVLSRNFFWQLKKDVDLSRHLNRPVETDWREYETEEERNEFHKNLGAINGSSFLNLGVDTTVTWPKDPTRLEFGGHQFVLFPKTKENSHSISIDLHGERLTHEGARTLLNRFLSLLSWCDNRHAILRDGWSGNPVPVPVRRREMGSMIMSPWIFNRSIPEDEKLLNCLSYYREGLNAAEAGIASLEVLSFFKVFEIGQKDGPKVKRWIEKVFEDACSSIDDRVLCQFHEDRKNVSVHEYVFRNCRVAAAHAAHDYPSDADASPELQRLVIAADIMGALARYFISTEFELSESYLSDEM